MFYKHYSSFHGFCIEVARVLHSTEHGQEAQNHSTVADKDHGND